MKFAFLFLALTLSMSALAQTSSRFRNEVTNNVTSHYNRVESTCSNMARDQYNAQPSFNLFDPSTYYKYEVYFLNRCWFNVKMRIMDNHISLAQRRINRLSQWARDRRDQRLAGEVRSLQQGLAQFRQRQNTERTRFQEEDYGWMGQEDITNILRRETRNVMNETYEMQAEMRFEGSL